MEEVLFKGAITEILTPMKEDSSLDIGALERLVEFQIKSGISGLFVNGLASEALMLSAEEQITIARETVRFARGRVPVMANIVQNYIGFAIDMLKRLEQTGVNAICITQPCIYGYSESAIYDYYAKMVSSTILPVYIYNAPQTSNTMSPKLVASLFNNFYNFYGYKDSTQDVLHLQTLIRLVNRDKFVSYISGSDGTIYFTLSLGGVGIISLISAVFPKPIIEVCNFYFAKEYEKAMKKQLEIIKIRDILKSGPFLGGYKYAAELAGCPVGNVRAPILYPNEDQKAVLKKNLEAMGLI